MGASTKFGKRLSLRAIGVILSSELSSESVLKIKTLVAAGAGVTVSVISAVATSTIAIDILKRATIWKLLHANI
jgi:hypothetical protein